MVVTCVTGSFVSVNPSTLTVTVAGPAAAAEDAPARAYAKRNSENSATVPKGNI